MKFLGLNAAQKEAVEHGDGPLLVLAGAGTGKTRVITGRIARLIERGEDPRSILALSFTNKAAREVAERVRGLVGDKAEGATMSTFHSLGLAILKAEGKRVGLGRGFTLAAEGERRSLLRQIAREAAPDIDPGLVGDQISLWKNKGLGPEDLGQAEGRAERALASAYALYQSFLKSQATVDFDDLLLLPLKILSAVPDARLSWAERFKHLLVDEYQDTNRVQFELLKLLASEHKNLTVVGDDDQAIYGWRGAEVELILRFTEHFPGARTVVLEENYRSTPAILEAANAVASGLARRHPKRLMVADHSEGRRGEPVELLESEDEDAEAERIASMIMAERFRSRRPWSDFAVLYRTNGQSRPFEQALRAQDVPHTVFGGNRFFDYKEVRDVMAYLRLILNPRDDAALMRIANVPKRGLGHQTMLKFQESAAASGVSLLTALERGGDLAPRPRQGARELSEAVNRFRGRFLTGGLTADGLEEMISSLGLKADVAANYDSPLAVKKRVELLAELPDSLEAMRKGRASVPLDEFIESLTLDPPLDREEDGGDAVRLMTLHSAKGLEFPFVFLAGMEMGLIPLRTRRGESEESLEEERRLCYVGMTRAQKRLFLSRASIRKRNGAVKASEPSPFLAEIPGLLNGAGTRTSEGAREEKKAMADDFFRNMREMFGNRPER